MCDFKPGDEVVAVDDDGGELGRSYELWLSLFLPEADGADFDEGARFVVRGIAPHPHIEGLFGVDVDGTGFYPHFIFRKVQRRNIQDWLKQETSYDEELHAPAPSQPKERTDA